MARFDVYRFGHGVPYVLDVQADILGEMGSRVVIPLVNAPLSRTKPCRVSSRSCGLATSATQ